LKKAPVESTGLLATNVQLIKDFFKSLRKKKTKKFSKIKKVNQFLKSTQSFCEYTFFWFFNDLFKTNPTLAIH